MKIINYFFKKFYIIFSITVILNCLAVIEEPGKINSDLEFNIMRQLGFIDDVPNYSGEKGFFYVKMHDKKIQDEGVEKILINVLRTEIISESGEKIILNDTPREVDLLKLVNNFSTSLGFKPVDTRLYSEIRIILGDNNRIVKAGIEYPLQTPSAQQSGLKIKPDAPFEVKEASMIKVTLDFVAEDSIVKSGSCGKGSKKSNNCKYILKPVINIDKIEYFEGLAEISEEGGYFETADGDFSVNFPTGQ